MKHLKYNILKTIALVGLLVFASGVKGFAQQTNKPDFGTNYSNTVFWNLSLGDVILLPDKSVGWTWDTSSQRWVFTTAGNNSSARVQYILMDPGNQFNGNPSSLANYQKAVTQTSGGSISIVKRSDASQVLLDWNAEGDRQSRPKTSNRIVVSCNVLYRVVLDNIWSTRQDEPLSERMIGGISFYPQSDGAEFDVYLKGDNRFGNVFYSSQWLNLSVPGQTIHTKDQNGQDLEVTYERYGGAPPYYDFVSAKLIFTSVEGANNTSGTLTVGNANPGEPSSRIEYGRPCTFNYYNSVIGGSDHDDRQNSRGITINGGTIFSGAEMQDVCTAIGGGGNGAGGVTINGGIVTAVTASTGTAIGGGIGWTQTGGKADVTITGGEVNAYNHGIVREHKFDFESQPSQKFVPATAIGGGSSFEWPCDPSTIVISGGKVFAQSVGGVAIGGGGSATMSGGTANITISGNADVTAESLNGKIDGKPIDYGSSIGGGVGGIGKGEEIANGGNCTFSMSGGVLKAGSVGGGSTNDSRGNIGFAKASISGSTTDIRAQFIMAAGGSEPCTFTMTGGTIHNNDINSTEYNLVKKDGGALWMDDPNGSVSISGNSVIENCKANSGGAVYTTGGAVIVTDATIQNCKALSGDGGAFAVMSEGATVTLSKASILGNTASGNGGAFFLKPNATVTITEGKVDNNTAGGDGGAFYGSAGSGIILNSGSIESNEAVNGGGVYLASGAKLTYTIRSGVKGYIRDNHASAFGGGAYLAMGSASKKTELDFVKEAGANTLGFYDNTADVGADDIFAYGRQTTLFTIPDVTEMNLERYSLPGATLQWWEDYMVDDTDYSDGTLQGDPNVIRRYRASRDALEPIWRVPKVSTDALSNFYEKYLCLTLGFEYGNMEIRRSGLHPRENAVYKIEFLGDSGRPAQYVTIQGSSNETVVVDGIVYQYVKIGFLPQGLYRVTETSWTWYNDTEQMDFPTNPQDISIPGKEVFTFKCVHKDLGKTPLHDEELEVNDLKP